MDQEWNPLACDCSLPQIKPEQLPCQPSAYCGEQDRPLAYTQTHPVEEKHSFAFLSYLTPCRSLTIWLTATTWGLSSFTRALSSLQPPPSGEHICIPQIHCWCLCSCISHKQNTFPWIAPAGWTLVQHTNTDSNSRLTRSTASGVAQKKQTLKRVQKKQQAISEGGERAEIFKGLSTSKSMCVVSKSVW